MGNQNGKYQQQNQSGKPKKNVHWKSAESPSPPGRPMLIPLSDQQPDVVNLRWERPKIDGGSPITGYVVEHRRMGSPHWVRATPTPVTNCEVSISGLEPGWRYQFRTFAENVVGRSEPSELSDPLTVTLQRNAISVPRFIDELQDMHAVEDERIEFRVRILGQPQPEISWFKDGYEIFSSRRTKIVNDNDVSVLIIHQVALTDEGEIRCTATNRAGHVVTKANLMVQAPPKIRLPRTYEDGMIVEADEMVRLKVGIAGQPIPTITWLHEGEVVQSGGRFEIINTDKNSLLKIDNIQREDRGEYSIRAINKLGEDVSSFLVTVTARPNAPGKVRLNMSFGKSATLSWTAPVDDGGCKIGNYIVEYFRVGWNVWLKAATTRSLSTTLHDLIEGSEYKFRVKAENPYGLSDPSEESDVLFIPDPKRGITKPKSASKIVEATQQNISQPPPPRRKTLSPKRPMMQDAATDIAVAIKRVSPNVARKARPQLLDSEDLHQEMSYGTSDEVLKRDVQKSPSMSSADSAQLAAKPNLRLNIQSNVSPAKTPPRSPTAERAQSKSSPQPLPMPDNNPSFLKSLLKPRLASPERSPTPDMNTAPILTRKRSKSPITPTGNVTPTRKSVTPEPKRSTKALDRSTEPVQLDDNQHVRRYSGGALSPAKDAPALAIAIALGNVGMANNISGIFHQSAQGTEVHIESNNGNGKVLVKDERESNALNVRGNGNGQNNSQKNGSKNNGANGNTNGNAMEKANGNRKTNNSNGNGNGNGRSNAGTLTNPTIQISAPPPPTNTPYEPTIERKSPSPDISPLSAQDKHDDVHTSNEFMLVVFDKNSKVKDKDKQDSFELDLEDAIQPPPISISSPDLASLEFTNLHSFPLRRSVSSTELLYERAMARFYEAVELEEAEKARKLKISQENLAAPSNVQPATVRKRLGAMTEAERLSFERRSELRRQSGDIGQDFKLPTKWSSRENVSSLRPDQRANSSRYNEPQRQESRETDELSDLLPARSAPTQEESFELGSDYTESTASSEEDSIEKFKMELKARTHSPSPRELDTYHPRNMQAGVFTPYRAPTPEQSAVVLNRPLPLPSPDFVPKPILKRSSNENMMLEASPPPVSPHPANSSNEKSMDLAKGIKSFFKRDKKSTTEKNTEENENMTKAIKDQLSAVEVETKRRTKEEEERKRIEAERTMLEEAKAAADHYSELMQQVSTTHSYHTPLYLDREELKKVTERAGKTSGTRPDDNDTDDDQLKKRRSQSPDMNSLQPPQMSNQRRLSISERGQLKHVRETASNLAIIQPKTSAKPIPDTPSESECEPSVSGLQQVRTVTFSPPTSPSPPPSPTLPTTTSTVISETYVERPDSRGRTRIVKVKKIIKKRVPSATGSREASTSRPPTNRAPMPNTSVASSDDVAVKRRLNSRTRSAVRGESKSPGPTAGRRPLQAAVDTTTDKMPSSSKLIVSLSNGQLLEVRSAEQLSEEAHEKVRSALSYSTDLVLFVVACYVYLFKDARLVLPILALLIYRQLGEALSSHIPHWMKRKKD